MGGTVGETAIGDPWLGKLPSDRSDINDSRHIEVGLRSTYVQLPLEPMTINGDEFGFEVDVPRIANAMNRKFPDGGSKITRIALEYCESLPGSLSDPDSATDDVAFEPSKNLLELRIPQELVSRDKDSEAIARRVELKISRDILLGMDQSHDLRDKKRYRKTVAIGSTLLAGTVLQGFNVLDNSETIGGYIERESFAYGLSAAGVITAAFAQMGYYTKKYGSTAAALLQKTRRTPLEARWWIGDEEKSYFDKKPLIKVNRLYPESEPRAD